MKRPCYFRPKRETGVFQDVLHRKMQQRCAYTDFVTL
nr:MAG TPA: hypothetical protein [Caudoviricetes sp.]